MVKKRELVAEKWERQMERDLEVAMSMDYDEFLVRHAQMGHSISHVIFELGMAKSWKSRGMQVYEFDPDFSKSILSEKWVELLPDCIQFRPHDCFYMKLPHNSTSEGVVVAVNPVEEIVNFDARWFPGAMESKGVHYGGVPGEETRALVNTGDEVLCLSSFAIPNRFEHMFDDFDLGVYPTDLVVNGVAYVCSANADIVKAYEPRPEARRNNAKRRSMATWHEVGYRIGAELRAYERTKYERQPHQGGTVRPHMRRAHWHHYWTGPRDGERRLVLKWLAPTVVGAGKIESATGHRVRAS